MLKKIAFGMFMTSLAVAGIVAWRGNTTHAVPTKIDIAPRAIDEAGGPNGKAGGLKIPISQVVLFNSGVGYFQRTGQVDGKAQVDLQFSAGDINDLIKSLVINDTKGKVLPLRYDSQEPIEKTLKSFAIDLSANPSYGQILNQMRGQKVEVTLATNNPNLIGLPGTMTGVIVGMETANRPHGTGVVDMELLNLSTSEGLRNVPIAAVQRVRFLNPTVENELRRALEVVAVGHDYMKKTIHLGFEDAGKREVKVGYVVENPIWKTSYRLVANADGKWRLLAWANVENTSDEDWNDIKLTLVSSRPISFQMDLYPPLFIPRPTVEPALFASLRPPTYGGPVANMALLNPGFGLQGGAGFGGGNGVAVQNSVAPNGQPMGGGGFNGFNGFGGQFGQQGGQGGLGNNLNPNYFNNRYQNERGLNIDNNSQKLTYEQLQGRRNSEANKNDVSKAKQQAQQIGSALTNVDANFIEQAKAADELGQPARYTIDQKVSLPRQQSVMLPILDEEIEAKKVSIYNPRVHASRPLHGLRIKNKSQQALMSGPVTVYEGEQPYNGDARMNDMQPGEERYISYALDTGVEIHSRDRVNPGPEMTAKVEGGRLTVQYKTRSTKSYSIVNRSPEPRKVVIEQAMRAGWKLVVPEKATETTAELYRFEVDVKPGETIKYDVSEELPRIDPFEITKQTDFTGFATSLGLDVWTDTKRVPEENFLVQIAGDQLRVTHKDRRTTNYHFHNHSSVERTIWLEHNIPVDRKYIGKEEPIEKDTNRYRFKLILKPDQTLSQVVTEELITAKPEVFPLQNLAGYRSARPVAEEDGPAQRYLTELGFEAWLLKKVNPETLVSGKFIKGELHTTSKEVEVFDYHIRNNSKDPRNFILDHQIRTNWKIVGEAKLSTTNVRCAQYTVKADAGKTIAQTVSEERTVGKKETLADISEERLKILLANAALKEPVKEALKKAYTMRTTLEATQATLRELRVQLKDINEEQARLRTNIEKLPQTSELYKRYLTKLDTAETTLEKVQSQITERGNDEKKQKKDYDEYLTKLNVE